ncbi:MAG: phosphate acyltransferase [Candidatus Omnitrophota bacterium]|jgi:phosphate acetyltransferase
MNSILRIREKARAADKLILLPEYDDKRTQEAAAMINSEGIARAVLLTPDKIDPVKKEKYAEQFFQMRKAKGMTQEEARGIFEDPLYYAAMETKAGAADGFVAGAVHTTPDMVRASILCLGVDKHIGLACSCFIMDVPDCEYGQNGLFIYADCGVIPDPDAAQVASIALAASELGSRILDMPPRVALLSYSTKGSAKGKSVEKMVEALKILRSKAPQLEADGELQVDAAIVPEVARIKSPGNPMAGKANILIFPDLSAGNISYKLTQRLAKARALGPILLGLSKPCSDLSRGCSAEDIVDCSAVTAVRAE